VQFSVDSEQVSQANTTIQATIGRLQNEVTNLHSQLLALNGSWQGVAASAFQELVQRWRLTSDMLDTQLGELGLALEHAAAQYREIEASNHRLFSA
jgi:6 kDa early secretory antigenic target